MTLKEKMIEVDSQNTIHEPNVGTSILILGCPADYPFLNTTNIKCNKVRESEKCEECWNREYKEEEEKSEKDYSKVSLVEYMNKKKHIITENLGGTISMGGCEMYFCSECPLSNKYKGTACSELEMLYPEEAIKRIMEYEPKIDWSKVPIDTKVFVR